MPFPVLALLLFFQQNGAFRRPETTPQQKAVNTLVAQIRRLAASEPAIYGVDTRIRTAEVLTQKYPSLAKDLLHDAQGELSGVQLPVEQDRMRVRLIKVLAPLDIE